MGLRFRRLLSVVAASTLLALVACAAPATSAPVAATPTPEQAGTPLPTNALQPDRSCKVDADCAVKNVGSCCGYQPACVNANAQVDPQAVQADCAARGIAGVCGFVEIQSCACVNARCEAPPAGAVTH
ncbi:hypothetical protein AO715_07070 [Xanthomonas sp. Mitacek01]|nr:hypothetical protein AO715_07070 [Xanthomonas sp. Mitacek01]